MNIIWQDIGEADDLIKMRCPKCRSLAEVCEGDAKISPYGEDPIDCPVCGVPLKIVRECPICDGTGKRERLPGDGTSIYSNICRPCSGTGEVLEEQP